MANNTDKHIITRGYFRAHAIKDTLIIDRQSSGFFADCSVRLHNIISFFNQNKRVPKKIDTTNMFNRYKPSTLQGRDIVSDFFQLATGGIRFINPIKYKHSDQYKIYDMLPVSSVQPFIKKYFQPNNKIEKIIMQIENDYNLADVRFDQTCTVLHRATDKAKETKIPSVADIRRQVDKIIDINPDIILLLQSDCAPFLEEMKRVYNDRCICFDKYIRTVDPSSGGREWASVDLQPPEGPGTTLGERNNVNIQRFLAIINILSRSKYVVSETGNCGAWLSFYRGHTSNMIQYQGKVGRHLPEVGWYNNL